MTNAKQNVRFKYVKIKSLHESIGYIEHFPDELESEFLRTIGKYIWWCQDKVTIVNKENKSESDQTRTINEMYRDKQRN